MLFGVVMMLGVNWKLYLRFSWSLGALSYLEMSQSLTLRVIGFLLSRAPLRENTFMVDFCTLWGDVLVFLSWVPLAEETLQTATWISCILRWLLWSMLTGQVTGQGRNETRKVGSPLHEKKNSVKPVLFVFQWFPWSTEQMLDFLRLVVRSRTVECSNSHCVC